MSTGSGRLQGKVAVITGASRGIGRSVALAFAREGAQVTLAAKTVEPDPRLPGTIGSVAAEVEALGSEALPVQVDVRNDEQVQHMVSKTMERFGRIDILVNNAGALWWRSFSETPMKRVDLVMGVNVRGAFSCTSACLPHMVAGDGGHVLVYSPPVDLSLLPGKVAYMISKYGMTMMAVGLAQELKGQNVAVNALWPVTLIETSATVNNNLGNPAMWRKPEIMADATLEVVTTSPADLTGEVLLDEDFLRERGVTDFSGYRCDPAVEPPRVLARDWQQLGRPGRG